MPIDDILAEQTGTDPRRVEQALVEAQQREAQPRQAPPQQGQRRRSAGLLGGIQLDRGDLQVILQSAQLLVLLYLTTRL